MAFGSCSCKCSWNPCSVRPPIEMQRCWAWWLIFFCVRSCLVFRFYCPVLIFPIHRGWDFIPNNALGTWSRNDQCWKFNDGWNPLTWWKALQIPLNVWCLGFQGLRYGLPDGQGDSVWCSFCPSSCFRFALLKCHSNWFYFKQPRPPWCFELSDLIRFEMQSDLAWFLGLPQ